MESKIDDELTYKIIGCAMKVHSYAQNDKRNSKVPFRGFRGKKSRKAATRNPVEALRNE